MTASPKDRNFNTSGFDLYMHNAPATKTTFKKAFCDLVNCPPEEYASRVFWRTIYPHAIPIATILRITDPRFFDNDLTLIKSLENVSDLRTIRAEVDEFTSINQLNRHTVRSKLKLRVSGRKLIRLASEVLPENPVR